MSDQFKMVEIRDFTLPDDAKCLCSHTHAEHSVRPTPMAIGKCSVCDCLTFMLDDDPFFICKICTEEKHVAKESTVAGVCSYCITELGTQAAKDKLQQQCAPR